MTTTVHQILQDDHAVSDRLGSIFGDYPDRISERRTVYLHLLDEFEKIYGNSNHAFLVRAPARINLKGMHVDHRGGHVNYMAIDREIVMAVGIRDDDKVVLNDQEAERYQKRSFSISEALPPEARGDWFSYIEQVDTVPGDWSNYIRAGVLKLQDYFKDRPLRGMNLLVNGNIPIGGGLSSSSALVVAACEASLQVNGLSLGDEQKTLLCGEGEWYVGTRGGAGDHAAIIYGRRGHLMRLRFFPLTVQPFPFPAGYRVIVCNSLKQARKSDGVRTTFNERVATYEIAMVMIRRLFPDLADRIPHLRDLNTEHLGVGEDTLYRILAALPESIDRKALQDMLPDHQNELERIFRTHDAPPDGYQVRSVCLYGMAECERSRIFCDFLRQGDMKTVGELMYLSHDGDRVVTHDGGNMPKPRQNRVTDGYLQRLIEGTVNGTTESLLWKQPGGYNCSCEELDHLVDIARTIPGVIGANLTGAGLGGCVLVVVREEAVETFLGTVHEEYYKSRRLEPATFVCTSVDHAGRIF